MNGISIYEFDAIASSEKGYSDVDGVHMVPAKVFVWLEEQCVKVFEAGSGAWIRWSQRKGRRVLQVTSFVGVIRSPDGFQIEVLPKVGKAIVGNESDTRQLLIDMLSCLNGFRHVQTDKAKLLATRMPLLEIFISEFLRTVEHIVKRGLRSNYYQRHDNLFALRGKLLISDHLRQNMFRADRFFTEHDEFTANRPENRLIHAALRRVLLLTKLNENQQLARELDFVFADVPPSVQLKTDFQLVKLDRGMGYYIEALAWVQIILDEQSPLAGKGENVAPSLLFPMEAVFEAFVAKHLSKQLAPKHFLKTQARSHHLVRHKEMKWFRLKPDLLIKKSDKDLMVLDTKWKIIDNFRDNGTEKYGLSQSDFYQLQAYGLNYLDGIGDVVLVYPKTDAFSEPLPVFDFPKTKGLRLWVLPFCLRKRCLILPHNIKQNALEIESTYRSWAFFN